ncbi:MAG: thiamine-phosphate kinase [Deltaproteobacteria bacterium]|nr:MAG: thiamine-phosphate kinase [Deltaproteobacteria bacterium]
MTERLRDRGERALVEAIRRLVPRGPGVVLGVGDDAAVLAPIGAPLLVTTDAMVEGVHFRSRWLSPRELGRRAFEVSASDVAAMGGRVLAAVLALAAPPMLPVASLRAIVAGVRDGARRAGGTLVGGNLASAGELAGARPGDRLFVTGSLGGAAFGLRSLLAARTIAAAAVGRWKRPRARLSAGAALARRGVAAAMIDLSDGLLIDTDRLCAASGVGARIDAGRLPLARALRHLAPAEARRVAVGGGEDYELLFAVRPNRLAALRAVRAALGCAVTEIGEVVRGRDVTIVADGRVLNPPAVIGHEHFAPRRRAGRR